MSIVFLKDSQGQVGSVLACSARRCPSKTQKMDRAGQGLGELFWVDLARARQPGKARGTRGVTTKEALELVQAQGLPAGSQNRSVTRTTPPRT